MNLLEQLNKLCRRLWREESGVVLAFTVIVFLSLFVIACSVYAVGENIRQRIELQNAADAAAYSAAVVQADSLSRIAAINKALAWEHVQMGREEMDYAVDVWFALIIQRWNQDYLALQLWLTPYMVCPESYELSWIGNQEVGPFNNCLQNGLILRNETENIPFNYYLNTYMHASLMLQQMISDNRTTIQTMNDEEASIINNLQRRTQNVVASVLQANAGYPNPQDYCYSLLAETDYFTILKDENRLLGFFTPPRSAANSFYEGVDVWFNLQPCDGIHRSYVQQGSSLRADWEWHGEGWQPQPYVGCVLVALNPGNDTVLGSEADTIPVYYQTETVKAQILTPDFFGPKGAIVVSVARAMRNPLLVMASDPSNPGLYGFFNPASNTGKPPYIWATAAARAGYHVDGVPPGEYWTRDSGGWLNSPANLSQADWDAELIPLPWVTSAQQLWNSPTWKALSDAGPGGSSLASHSGGQAPNGNLLH